MTSTTNRYSAATYRGTKRNNVREGAIHASAGTKPEGREYVQGELALEADFDLRVLTSWRARHILSLGNEPSPSPYSAAREPGYLAACLNPAYLPNPQDGQEEPADPGAPMATGLLMNAEPSMDAEPSTATESSAVVGERSAEEATGDLQKTEAGEEESETENPAGVSANEESDGPPPLFNPDLSPEELDAACREYVRCCTAQLMRYAEPADELVVEALASLGTPLAVYYLLTGERVPSEIWECGEPDPQIGDFLRGVTGIVDRKSNRSMTNACDYYRPGEHQMDRDTFRAELATRRLRWNRRMERTLASEAHMAATFGAWLVTPADSLWPGQLRDLGPAQPYGLWCLGDSRHLLNLANLPSVALVGSRDPSIYGSEATTHLTAELARRGYLVISGGAMGIDIAAHRAALTHSIAELPTVAFMAGGLDRLYPAQNGDTLRSIVERGLIMSEVSIGNTPTRWRFLERNRLIAGLARHTVVVEARWRSGALNTARHALEIGRPLWAVPGQINSPNSVGTNRLLRDGLAQILTEAADLLEYDAAAGYELGAEHSGDWYAEVSAASTVLDELTERQGRVWDNLGLRSYRGVDDIASALGMGAREVMMDLSQLERLGLAESNGTSWRKVRPKMGA